jgi:hypothetical protein
VRVALCLAVVLLLSSGCQRQAEPVQTKAGDASVRQQRGRITYPTDHLPILLLPGGEQQSVRSMLESRRSFSFGDYIWDDEGVPAGPVWIRVDLQRQTLSIFRAGHEIGSAVIVFGENSKPTPIGIFPILQKKVDHQSTLYDAEMPYMLRLTGDGVAIHAGHVRPGSATHGCIGVPLTFARLLYAQVKLGDRVAIVRS